MLPSHATTHGQRPQGPRNSAVIGRACDSARERLPGKRARGSFAVGGGYAGPKLAGAIAGLPVALEIVKRTDKDGSFKVIRRRWVIERTFSWLRRNRRLTAHYEALAITAVGYVKLAMISLMLKRLTQVHP